MSSGVSIIGFDSAWTDRDRAPGALCIIRIDARGGRSLSRPVLVSFDQASTEIEAERVVSPLCIVALDQPTIVPNASGMRPVDRVAASLISWLGGGVQPANQSKVGMFDDNAPIWGFKRRLAATEDPELSRDASDGLFLIEVFPALALPFLDPSFFGLLRAPRYNPARRSKFTLEHWRAVLAAVRRIAERDQIAGLTEWVDEEAVRPKPGKADQDRLDAVLCAIVGLRWRTAARETSIMIGDLTSGYMIAPASAEVRLRLVGAALKSGVPVDTQATAGP